MVDAVGISTGLVIPTQEESAIAFSYQSLKISAISAIRGKVLLFRSPDPPITAFTRSPVVPR